MKLSITALKTDRHWQSAIGLNQKRFAELLIWVEKAYQQIHGKSIEERQAECPEEPALNTYTDLRLFTLFSRSGGPV